MPIRWGEKECVDILESVIGDYNWNMDPTSNCTTSYPIPKPTKPSKATKKQHLTRDRIKKVIFSNPATIVFWDDGSKTVVKCSKRDNFDPEKGLAMAIAKRALGNKGNYYNTFVKYIPELRDKDDVPELGNTNDEE